MFDRLPKAKHPALRRLLNSHVCILCARPAEAEGIARALGFTETLYGHSVSLVDNGHTFYMGSWDLGHGNNLDYYVTHVNRQGVQSFLVDASILFYILRPRHVLHAGVCAGYRDRDEKHKLADVIFADGAINYEEGKYDVVNGQVVFRPDFDKVRVPTDMQSFADNIQRPNYHYGDFITGSAVRGDAPRVFERVRDSVGRKAIGLDMESSAFLQLCLSTYFTSGDRQMHCLGVLKGISDFGDEKKDEDQKAQGGYDKALENTGKAIEQWVKSRVPASTLDLKHDHEPAAGLLSAYVENLVRPVCTSMDISLPAVGKTDKSFQVDAKEIHGFKVVLPPEMNPLHYCSYVQISSIVKDYGMVSVITGKERISRDVYYKHGYLIDFPRIINDLVKYEDSQYQTEIFAIMLSEKEHFKSSGLGRAPDAEVCSWESFQKWLDEQASAESITDRARVESPSRIGQNGVKNNSPQHSNDSAVSIAGPNAPGGNSPPKEKRSFTSKIRLRRQISRDMFAKRKATNPS